MADPLLQALCTDPDNVHLRLVYADYLEERGDPRADFIRVQCQLADMDEDDDRWAALKERELELFNRHGEQWLAVLGPMCHKSKFRCGFVDEVHLSVDDFLEHGEQIGRSTPLRLLALRTALDGHGLALAKCAALKHLTTLGLHGACAAELQPLLRSEYLSNLRELLLYNAPVHLDELRAILSANCKGMQALHLPGVHLGASEMELLSTSNPFADLQTLILDSNEFGSAGLQFLAASRRFPHLRRLGLHHAWVVSGGVRALAATPHLTALTDLDLRENDLSGEALEALAASARPALLTNLRWARNRFGSRAAKAVGGSKTLASLTRLDVEACNVTPAILADLLKGFGDHLVDLNVSNNALGDEGIKILARSPRLAKLRRLRAWNCGFTAWGLKELLWSPHLGNLRRLSVSGNELHDRGREVVAARPPRPASLQVLGIQSDEEFQQWLANNSFALGHLDWYD